MTASALISGQSNASVIVNVKNAIEGYSDQQKNVKADTRGPTGATYTYYSNGRMQSMTLDAPDAAGNIYYYYLNENWNNQGYGRIYKSRRQDPSNGELSYIYFYYAGSDRIRCRKAYSDANWKSYSSIYYHYNNAANRIEYRQLVRPDYYGYIYYHYMDEDFNGQGFGRVDKSRRKVALNGELSYTYTYYADNPARIKTSSAYATATWTKAVATYTYYNNDTNRIESKTLVTSDTSGNIYYHYMDEDWNTQGYGRVDKSKRQVALNGEFSYTYIYYADSTGRLEAKNAYSDASWTTFFSTYSYYNNTTNRQESKTLVSPDSEGNIYYHYMDENWAKTGIGRIDRSRRQTAINGELSHIYSYYGDAYGRLQTQNAYSDASWANLVTTYAYYNNGYSRLQSKIEAATGTTYTYYNNTYNRLESKALLAPDAAGYIYYYYFNEDFNGQGYGRIYKAKRQTASNGELSYIYFYYGKTDTIRCRKAYSDSNWKSYSSIYYHYNNTSNRIEYRQLVVPDTQGNIYYHYMDENFNGQGYGRIDRSRKKYKGEEYAHLYIYYDDATGRLKEKMAYSDIYYKTLVATYAYYNDATNRLESKTYANTNVSGVIYLHYINESWHGMDKYVLSQPVDGHLSCSITYYPGVINRIDTKNLYSDANWTNLIVSYTYYYDSPYKIKTKFDPATGITYSYYNDTANRMESKTLPVPDAQDNICYYYFNEDWAGQGYGRIEKVVRNTADAEGVKAYTLVYYSNTTQVQYEYGYLDDGFTSLYVITEYDVNGVVINKTYMDGGTYTFYASGLRESVTYATPDGDGNVYYHYLDENWNGQGYGRVDKSRRETALNSELSHRYIYDESTGALKEIRAYSDANWTLLLPKTLQQFIDVGMDYFAPGTGVVEPIYGYPHEGIYHKNYTQPTNIGFYAQLLANVISSDIIAEKMSQADAIAALNKMMTSLLSDQQTLGYKGLLPWMSFNGSAWQRDGGAYGKQVVFGDNSNLSACLGAAIGALSDPSLAGNADVQLIKQKMEQFLDAQAEGYSYLYDAGTGSFKTGWNFVTNSWLGGHVDNFGSEFRAGALFVMLRYNFGDSVYAGLNGQIQDYVMSDGSTVYTVAPYDGGAFQMLWPTLTMPEIDNPAMNQALHNFVNIALDFSAKRNLPGFLSACYSAPSIYAGNAGIAEISVNTAARNETVASLYTLGAAHMVDPAAIDQFLADIFVAHPDLVTTHGLWEGFNTSTNTVIHEQIVTNVATFLIGMAGKGPEHMTTYLQDKGLYARLQSIYQQYGPADLISGASNAYTWGSGAATSYRSGDEYFIISPAFTSNSYTAFIQNNANLSGTKLKLTYKSTTDVGIGKFEIKQRDINSTLQIRMLIDKINFVNTGGVEKEIIIDLPATLSLVGVDEIILVLSGCTGVALDMTITDLDLI
ncbi:MAG: hypothetical protein PHP46_03660 [Candidatus Omnitrophica bacterium]|nr:hypothetical protein [Candidatus Omnitrophota bacterium]